jgi:hypothetical protein
MELLGSLLSAAASAHAVARGVLLRAGDPTRRAHRDDLDATRRARFGEKSLDPTRLRSVPALPGGNPPEIDDVVVFLNTGAGKRLRQSNRAG